MPNIYRPFDLGAFSPDLAGETIQVLQNPTRNLRVGFLPSSGAQFLDYVAQILDVTVPNIDFVLGSYDAALFTWLFVPVLGDDGRVILPYVYTIWDDYAAETIKKLRSASPQRESAPAAA